MPNRTRTETLSIIEQTGIVGILRAESPDQLVDVCRALREGGVIASEITMTTPKALSVIETASEVLGKDCVIGVGSVLDPETARTAILAGAQYIVCPTFNPAVVEMAHRYDKPVMPGALTPTEIINAWSAGSDLIKVFPADYFGPKYIKDIHGPMPQVKMIPTGGINLDNAGDWIRKGATALGVGTSLVNKQVLADRNWSAITQAAKGFIDAVRTARQS